MLIEKCIKSWEKYCPDWEIIEWNESNFDVNFCEFTKKAYEEGKWAFVSDIARLKVVYDNGGIYIDTDVEILSHNPFDNYLYYKCFFFFANIININTGAGFGGEKGDFLIKRIMDDHCKVEFSVDKMRKIACPAINTPSIQKVFPSFIRNGKNQVIEECAFISEEEYSKVLYHHGALSWRTEDQ